MEKREHKLLFYKLSERLFNALQNNLQLERRQALLVKLGIDTVLNVIPKLIITIVLALLLHELVPVLVFMSSFLVLRGFAYGRHLKSDLLCTILTVVTFVGVPYLVQFTNGVSELFRFLLCLILTLPIGIFSPAVTRKNPIKSHSLKKSLKHKAIVVSLIFSILQFFINNNFGTLIVVSMLLVFTLIVPLKGGKTDEAKNV
ncbi:accessory gene regulator AgrB [Lactiplantibacillus paraplantarum]|uniref:Putative AgrB-like protein n=1 Tax=Lactiplantibacillus paraplantarum TaxID=60520 RepID=A0ABQ0NBY9_9LACO|nr:accessory gene regulator AgrB [Lactiplantibacillus paraplantarum]MCU4685203.1 accessory gene regulator AgrB [Lactiplantibacillus paraplantarum]QJU50821.1 putative AgrB-like protein [Lactiplantibacillus paraplantarum]RKD27474.1 accessory regulator AgrB [Lactiplantibacillus paraplantarum]UKB40316.1 accessory gene regulator AgrB [Lactiplantibacillus paraplantarum]GBF02607.1 accessory gene regulator AgrB [Lactiplantibacillus paraplantarum]